MSAAPTGSPEVLVEVEINASRDVVWEELRHIKRHEQWMADAEEIRFCSDHTEGLGTTFECDTKVGPFRLTDVMEITEWVPPERMGVRHVGIVTGVGTFVLTAEGDRTLVQWIETLFFPWWMGGRLGGAAARPVLRWVWRRNLRRLATRIDGETR